ncbi:hypothetical protein GF367_02275 [Candidatus Woesearchaeota archaeon]|nr:hypothetical protein [Candidatus Woesearchaeota archaeon]
MAETKTLVWLKPLKYSGLIDMKGVYKTMDKWFAENHYDKVERRNNEHVSEEGRQIVLELVPYKKITDYAQIQIRVYAEMLNLKEEVVERNGLKHKYHRGDLFFSFDCFLITDYEEHWETKATYYFIRTLVDKFVYRGYTKRFEKEAVSDCNELINEIKNYLNMERFK